MTNSTVAISDDYVVIEGELKRYRVTHFTIEQHQGANVSVLDIIDVDNDNYEQAHKKALDAFANKIIKYSRANSVNLGPSTYTLYLVENFLGHIGDKIIIGAFSGARLLNSGDYVKAVAKKREDGGYFVYAIQRERDELLWLPVTVMRGERSAQLSNKKAVFIMAALSALIAFIVAISMGGKVWFELFLIASIGTSILWWIIYLTMQPRMEKLGGMAEILFQKLGFPDPQNLSFLSGRYEYLHDRSIKAIDIEYNSVYYYGLVLAAREVGRDVPVTLPALPVETPDNQAEVQAAYLKLKEMVSQPKE